MSHCGKVWSSWCNIFNKCNCNRSRIRVRAVYICWTLMYYGLPCASDPQGSAIHMNSQGGGPCTQPGRLEPSRYKRHERLISSLFLYLYSCWTVRYKVQLPPISLLIILKDYQIIYAKNIIIYHMGLTPSTLQTIICYINTFLLALNQNLRFIVV